MARVLALLPTIGLAGILHADTVRVTVGYYSDQTEPYFKRMAAEFEKSHPGNSIQIEVVNWDSMQQKLQTDIAGGTNADLALIGTRWLLDFVKDGLAEPLDAYMDAAFRNRFIGAFLAPSQIGGKAYGLPFAASARALYYNKETLAKAGFPNGPRTWDDVVSASRKIKAAGSYGFGMQGKEIETDVYWYYALWAFGGDVVSKSGQAAFDSPAGIKAAQLYKSMIDEGLTQPGVTNYSREDVQNLFKQGRVAMVITAPFLSKQIKKEAPTLKYGIAPVPKGTTNATYAVTDSIMMFRSSKVKKTAWQFLDFLFTKGPRVAFTSGEGFLPTTREEALAPEFSDPDTKVFVSLLPNARFAPTITGWEDTAKAVSDAMQSIYLGKVTPQAALKKAAEEADKNLGK